MNNSTLGAISDYEIQLKCLKLLGWKRQKKDLLSFPHFKKGEWEAVVVPDDGKMWRLRGMAVFPNYPKDETAAFQDIVSVMSKRDWNVQVHTHKEFGFYVAADFCGTHFYYFGKSAARGICEVFIQSRSN